MTLQPPARDMDSWVAVLNGRWHQAKYDGRTGTAVLRCSGQVVTPRLEHVMDYRWRPGLRDPWCRHRACREEVQP